MNQNTDLQKQITPIEKVFDDISQAKKVVLSMAACEPTEFYLFLSSLEKSLFDDTTIYCANPSEPFDCFKNTHKDKGYRFGVMFLTDKVRDLQGNEHVHYIPCHLSRWVRNLSIGREIDVFWGSCTPPDSRGFVSIGPSNCYESEMIRKAKKVVLEINPDLPHTYGDTLVDISSVDFFVKKKTPRSPPAIHNPVISEEDRKIASYIAELVEDESTIQLGIGSIPNAIGDALSHKKNLGVHTEMINDTIMNLYKKGVINGSKKSLWPNKIVGAFAYGSAELYEFINANPVVEFHPASIVNDPYRFGRNHKMVSINTAVEVDITGQVCSESIGHLELSGVGGAFETHVGAQRSEGGKGIIALKSTTKSGSSKINMSLMEGAKVSLSRNDIDTIVTEYGVARLLGKSVMERAKALIAISHPKYREELLFKAKELKYI